MEVQTLKQLIKTNKLPNFLIFTGEEWKVQQIYIQNIAKVTGLDVISIDSIMDIWRTLGVKSLVPTRNIYVLRDDKELLITEQLYMNLTERLGENILILTLYNADKRLKMLKMYNNSIVEFKPLKPDILKQYIQKEIDLNDRNCGILMEICGHNYGHCLLEIDKILQYVDGCVREYGKSCDVDINEVFKSLLEDGTIYVPPKDTLWDFIKAFLQDKPRKAYDLYMDLKELGTATLVIIANLYNNTKQVLQVQECHGEDVARRTGLTSWQIRNAQECVGIWEAADLLYLMKLLQKLESGIKKGTIDEAVCIDYLFANYY